MQLHFWTLQCSCLSLAVPRPCILPFNSEFVKFYLIFKCVNKEEFRTYGVIYPERLKIWHSVSSNEIQNKWNCTSILLREEHRLRVLENRFAERGSSGKRDEVTGGGEDCISRGFISWRSVDRASWYINESTPTWYTLLSLFILS
jgi:hypothetical protein